MRAEDLLEELMQAKQQGKSAYTLRDKDIRGKLDLSNRTFEVAMDFEGCHFRGGVDLRYCEFKQVVSFRGCIFRKGVNSGDDVDSYTVYRKNLVCDGAIFVRAAQFRGVRCEGHASFRGAWFPRTAPLVGRTDPDQHERAPVDFTGASFTGGLDCRWSP